MTLEEALALIPTHIMLRPGIDKWQQGDELQNITNHLISGSYIPRWIKVKSLSFGKTLPERAIGRRQIPESVRQDMAMRLFGMSYMDNTKYINDQMRTATPFEFWVLSGQKELT